MTAGTRGRVTPLLARHGIRASFILAVLLSLPAINAPLFEDDLVHRAMLRNTVPGVHWGPLELYEFVGGPARQAALLRDRGVLPWFSSDDLRLRFFRPLSSAVLAADARLAGNRFWLSRLHGLLWFLVILWASAGLYRRFLDPATAALATLIYSVSIGHAMPVWWIAARHGLIATALAVAAFASHVRSREQHLGWVRLLAVVAFAAGLLAGEMALGALALVACWELFGRSDPKRTRVAAVIPYAAVTVIYVALYATLGYGVRGSGAYIGADSGTAGAVAAVRHFLILAGELTAALSSDLAGLAPARAQAFAAVLAVFAVIAAWTVFRSARGRIDSHEYTAVRWMAPAAAAAAAPGALAIIGGRVLTLALVPSSAVVAILLLSGVATVRDRDRSLILRGLVALVISVFAVMHLLAAPVLRIVIGHGLGRIAVEAERQVALTPSCGGDMVIVAASDPTIAFYVPVGLTLEGRTPGSLRVLSMAQADHRVEHVTRTGFDLVARRDARSSDVWEQLYRRAPLRAGTRVTLTGLDATVVGESGGAPTRVRFEFGKPLDSPDLCFEQWHDGRILPLAPPKAGQILELRHEPGPMGF